MPALPPPARMRQCPASSRSFLRRPDGPCGDSTWTSPALRRSYKARENRDQNKISSDQSVHGLRGTRAALSRLDAQLGEWEMGVSFEAGYFGPGSPPVAGRGGRTTFEWLDGQFFLIQRFTVDNPAAPERHRDHRCG
jgi:hypothetical protein